MAKRDDHLKIGCRWRKGWFDELISMDHKLFNLEHDQWIGVKYWVPSSMAQTHSLTCSKLSTLIENQRDESLSITISAMNLVYEFKRLFIVKKMEGDGSQPLPPIFPIITTSFDSCLVQCRHLHPHHRRKYRISNYRFFWRGFGKEATCVSFDMFLIIRDIVYLHKNRRVVIGFQVRSAGRMPPCLYSANLKSKCWTLKG